jgi:hypothetical protein
LDSLAHLITKVRKALHKGGDTHTIEDVLAALYEGRMQAFANDAGIIVTELCATPRKKYINMFLAAGEMDAVKALAPRLIDFARENDIHHARAAVRPGFVPALKTMGWRPTQICMEYENGQLRA